MPSPISSFQTRIDVAPEVRQRVILVLNQQLAQTLDLYTQTKQAHWNVKGTEFFQLHELFDLSAEPNNGEHCGRARLRAPPRPPGED